MYYKSRKPKVKYFRINERIKAPNVRLKLSDGQTKVVPIQEAISMAREQGLELVEVAPNQKPPVCEITDYGKFKYQQEKKQKLLHKHQHISKLKEIKFRSKTGDHDYQYKLKHIKEFLERKDKVKVTIFFKGREIVHKELGLLLLQRIVDDLKDYGRMENQPLLEGRNMYLIMIPTK